MTAKQFDAVVALAKGLRWAGIDDSVLHGCATRGFRRVGVPMRAAAAFLNYHCLMFNGEWDTVALEEMRGIFRDKVTLLDFEEMSLITRSPQAGWLLNGTPAWRSNGTPAWRCEDCNQFHRPEYDAVPMFKIGDRILCESCIPVERRIEAGLLLTCGGNQ